MTDLTQAVTGNQLQVPLPGDRMVPYAFLDNAASTPVLKRVQQKLDEFIPYYSSIHRGSGFKSRVATHAYESARDVIRDFVGAGPDDMVAMTRNATESINVLAHFMRNVPGDRVIISEMEHHANDLPWREIGQVVHIPTSRAGLLDLDFLDQYLSEHAGQVKLVSLTGASNVTGTVTDLPKIVEICHRHGRRVHIDAAQLAPHKPINMSRDGIDYLSISAHKMYAPYGAGALIGKSDWLQGEPLLKGGGCIDVVTPDAVVWADPPEKLEAGTPNVTGVIAMAEAARSLIEIGFELLEQNEVDLTQRFLAGLQQIPSLEIIGQSAGENVDQRLGVISVLHETLPFERINAALEFEYGIGTRGGCFCAHPFIMKIHNISTEEALRMKQEMAEGTRRHRPGLTRFSLGLFNTEAEVDRALVAMERIAREEFQLEYQLSTDGEYRPRGYHTDMNSHFTFR